MKCQNGALRNEQDSTLLMMHVTKNSKLQWTEYAPIFILIILVACLFATYL